ncbi:hypothetical protein BGX28_003077 [Mortierella sp. GBA30]|nr:hypothetical protein BGX28_003077 [Mortierella sp. GBA30]
MLNKKGAENPVWWISLHSVFGPVLEEFDSVVLALRSNRADAAQAKEAVQCMEMLIIHLSYALLGWFEQQQDLDGILAVYETLALVYSRGDSSENTQAERWPSIEDASAGLRRQLRAWTERDFVDAQRELTKDVYAEGAGGPLREASAEDNDKLKVQEKLMDLYVIEGEFNKAMACALIAVRMQEERGSPIKDRSRILEKATMVAQTAGACMNLFAARTIIERTEAVLKDRKKRPWHVHETVIKNAILASLEDALLLLRSCGQEYAKTTTILLCRARRLNAEMHREEPDIAAKWVIAAQVSVQAAGSIDDEYGLNRYANKWLLEAKRESSSNLLELAALLLLARELRGILSG